MSARGRARVFLLPLVLLLLPILPAFVATSDATSGVLAEQLRAPDSAHWFGTDLLGRDVLARTASGVRSSLFVGMLAALTSLVIGVTVGSIAGFSGPRVDRLLMRTVDVLYGIPFICLVIFLLAILRDYQTSLRAHGITRDVIVYLAVGCTTWLTMARLVRNEVLRIRAQPFVEAAQALGLSRARMVVRHVLPNCAGVVLVALTLTIPSIVLYEAFLSFLGLGIEPPSVSLGMLAAEGVAAMNPIRASWWLVVFPGAALSVLLLGFSLLGDAMQEAFDPRTRTRE